MKFRGYLYLLAVLFFASCSNQPEQIQNSVEKRDDRNHALNKPPSSFSDTIQIHSPSAIFYEPDSLQLLAIKNITDSMVFKSATHESFYQMRYSKIILKRDYPSLKIVELKRVRFILFAKNHGGQELIDLNTKNDPFGLLVFDGNKSPQFMDMTNVETSLGNYFNK